MNQLEYLVLTMEVRGVCKMLLLLSNCSLNTSQLINHNIKIRTIIYMNLRLISLTVRRQRTKNSRYSEGKGEVIK
jgi:hypothetical protein